MDDHERHHRYHDIVGVVLAVSALIFAVSFMFLVIWMATAEQNTKLYEADNVVCASQPFSMTCYERKKTP